MKNCTDKQGFSLIELLVVIALLALAVGFSAPALVEIARGQGLKRAIGEVSGVVEQARTEAMAKSTWTWVGLAQQTTNGQSDLLAVLVASRDGTTNITATNLTLLSPPVRIKNVKILPDKTRWAVVDGTVVLTNSSFSFVQTIQGKQVTFSSAVLGFSPLGEASLTNSGVPPWIEIGLREMRGLVEITNKTVSIRISGFAGDQLIDY